MSDKRQLIPITGLLVTMVFTTYMVVQISGHGTPAPTGNFTNAAVAEVKDAQGQVLLQGQFVVADEDDDDIERKATLTSTVGADAAGEAEVEFAKSAPATQEIEFSVSGLQAGATFTFVIDGQDLATATANQRGRAEVEVDVKMPGTSSLNRVLNMPDNRYGARAWTIGCWTSSRTPGISGSPC